MFGRRRPTGATCCQALAMPCVLTLVCPVAYTMMTVKKRVRSPVGRGRQGRFSCLMTCRGQEANGFQQHNHFKRRRVWRIGRTTRLPTRRPAVWQNDLNSVPHRSSSVLSLRSCLAGGFSRNFCSADRINPCSSAMRRISRMLLWTVRSVTISVRTGRSTPCPLQRTVLSAIRRCSAKARPNGSSSTNTSRRARKWTGKSTRSSLTTCSSAMPCTRWQPVTTVMSSPSGSFAPRAISTWLPAKSRPCSARTGSPATARTP